MVTAWTHNAQIVLEPNPNWTGRRRPLTRIEISIGGDPAAALAAWERGDLDICQRSLDRRPTRPRHTRVRRDGQSRHHAVDRVLRLRKLPGRRHLPAERGCCRSGRLPGLGPTQNVNFRRALTQAIDRAELIQVGFAGLGAVVLQPDDARYPRLPDDHGC